jgi:hypothetical protein
MRVDYTINIPIDVTELHELLEGEELQKNICAQRNSWIFPTNEEQDVRIRVNIQTTGLESGGDE